MLYQIIIFENINFKKLLLNNLQIINLVFLIYKKLNFHNKFLLRVQKILNNFYFKQDGVFFDMINVITVE